MARRIRTRAIRAGLPVLRLLGASMPLSPADAFLRVAVKRVRLPAGVVRRAVSADGVPCEWLIPKGSSEGRALLYLHGGGWVFGVSPLHLKMVAYLAQRMGVPALMVDYRLSPRHPFPAALDDCVAAYSWLLREGIPAERIVVAGDSAGGNLTIAAMMKLRDGGERLPAAAACLSPAVSVYAGQADLRDMHDPLLHPRALSTYFRSYVGRHDPRDPLISPVLGDWHGLPPLLVHAGEDEIFRDDAVRIERLAKAAGVEVRLQIYPDMWHVWQVFLALPEATASLDDIARFLQSPPSPR